MTSPASRTTPSPTIVAFPRAERLVCIGRTAAVLGAVGILGHAVGAALLRDVLMASRSGDVAGWLAGAHAAPVAATVSAWAFVIGLAAIAAFVALVAAAARPAHPGPFVAGIAILALGALVAAAGAVAPAVAVGFTAAPPDAAGAAVGGALLGLALHLGAAFDLAAGAGLLLVSLGAGGPSGWPLWLRALGAVAGAASLPAFLRPWIDGLAVLHVLAAALVLAWIGAVSARAARGRI
jgi:hypothetical protein